MIYNSEGSLDDRDNHPEHENNSRPNAYRVEDDNNIDENDLVKSLIGEDHKKPIREGEAMGGQNFGKNNNTPAGDDKNNPSQNAGYTNAYFARTEPSEEHPEDSNFKDKNQDGSPDYNRAQPHSSPVNEAPKPEKQTERGNGGNDRPHEEEPYRKGTADNDKEPNVPGPNELPDQQKVGEDKDHIET